MSKKMESNGMTKEIYLAGGCFWGLEKYLGEVDGVTFTEVGYANGKTPNPTYQEVCLDYTGYAETVYVKYDFDSINLSFLLGLYFDVINPVSVNRQGPDIGSQYRTGIYYVNEEDKPIIEECIKKLQMQYKEPIAIEVGPLVNYYKAEKYHQKYLDKNPGGYCHISWEQINKVKTKTAQK